MKKTNIILVTALALFCFVAEKASAQYWILPKASNGTSTAWSYMEASLDDGLTAGYQSATFDYSSWAVGQSGFGKKIGMELFSLAHKVCGFARRSPLMCKTCRA